MKTDILPLVVGVSLCGASAVLLYIWYKTKDQDHSDTTDAPKSSTSALSSKKDSKVECTIPNSIVPLVLGRSGANVKAIEEKTKTVIRFREKDENNQICEITGLMENVKRAAEMIKQEASPPPNITEEMFVPQSSCGKIIGRCGEALQEICRKSMAKVHVDAGDRSDGTTRRILITGTRAHVNIAKSLIEEKIRKDVESKGLDIETKREPRGSPRYNDDNRSNCSADDIVVPVENEKLSLNKSDGQLEVFVSAIASPSRFWIQLVGPQSLELDKLVETMTEYYSVIDNQKLHKIADPYLGQIVAAMFKYDGKWYRAEIVGILPNEYYPRDVVLDLYFVDFGDSEYVAPCEVFELRTDFLKLRFQAIECFLANVKPVNKDDSDTWDPEAISLFEELTHVAKWKKCLSKVVTTKERKQSDTFKKESSPIPGVELFNSTDGPGVDISIVLTAEGFAVPEQNVANRANNDVLRLDGGHKSSTDNSLSLSGPSKDSPQTNDKPSQSNGKPSQSNGELSQSAGNSTQTQSTIDNKNNYQQQQNGSDQKITLTPTPTSSTRPLKNRLSANFSETDKFSAICENSKNENYENLAVDNRNQTTTNSFIDAERRNGNMQTKTVDKNSNNEHNMKNVLS